MPRPPPARDVCKRSEFDFGWWYLLLVSNFLTFLSIFVNSVLVQLRTPNPYRRIGVAKLLMAWAVFLAVRLALRIALVRRMNSLVALVLISS